MSKTLGLVIASPFADWEAAPLSAMAKEWFGVKVVWLAETPNVTSIGGLSVMRDRDIALKDNQDLDGVVLIGPSAWENGGSPNIIALLKDMHQRGGVVAAICGGTIPLAHSGLLKGHSHTSNNGEWLASLAKAYQGYELYAESPVAVSDGTIITASALAPVTFATAVLSALLPEQTSAILEAAAVFATEHAPR